MALQHLRASVANKRPVPSGMSDGQLAINTNDVSPGLFLKNAGGVLVKIGPVHVGTAAPNVTPASGGTSGNTTGELWLDSTGGDYALKTWDGSAWRTTVVTSEMIKDGTISNADINNSAAIALSKLATGALPTGITVSSGNIVDGTITNADVNASAGIVYSKLALSSGIVDADINASAAIALSKLATGALPAGITVSSGNIVDGTIALSNLATGALPTGITIASGNIVDGTIIDADVNASAAIAGTKISPDFGGQNITTSGNIATSGTTTTATLIASGDIQATSFNSGALAGMRNAIINGNFDIWQRGTSQTAAGYGSADRYASNRVGTTCTMSRQAFTLGQTDVPGEPTYFCRMAVTSVAGAGNLSLLEQKIEDVRTFAGQQITVSFWAKADAAKPISVELVQAFGSGGSPSSGVDGLGISKVTLGTSWQKITTTVSLPSISGKTLGTDNNNALVLRIWFDAGSTYNSNTDTLGQQSGTFDIAQVQLEPGAVATPFERRPYGLELALCQRYYETGNMKFWGYSNATQNIGQQVSFSTKKRAAPSIVKSAEDFSNISSITVESSNVNGILVYGTLTATGPAAYSMNFTASAEL